MRRRSKPYRAVGAPSPAFTLDPTIRKALQQHRPVVGLESAVFTHGLPATEREPMAEAMQAAVRAAGAVPAVIALLDGQVKIGLSQADWQKLLRAPAPAKCARVDLGWLSTQRASAGTTVSATIHLAAQAGIEFVVTGGIGGVHRQFEQTFDISADLFALTRTPITLVCSGPKSIADFRKTYEYLETHSVPILGYQTRWLPGFYLRDTGIVLRACAETLSELAAAIHHYRQSDYQGGIVVANPVPAAQALPPAVVESWLAEALRLAAVQDVKGPALTPFLLASLNRLSAGATLRANKALLVANAQLAGRLAVACQSSERVKRRHH